MRDLQHRVAVLPSLASTAIATATTTNGVGVDTYGVAPLGPFESVTFWFQLLAWTNGTFTPSIQVSADNANWYNLDQTGYLGQQLPAGMGANGTLLQGIQNMSSSAANAAGVLNTSLRYVRAVETTTGGTVGGTAQAIVLLGYPRHSGLVV